MRSWPIWLGALTCAACAGLLAGVGPTLGGDRLRFSHARHATAKVECIVCHEGVYDATDLGTRHLPREATCLGCHREEKQEGRCATCHADVAAIQPRPPPDPHLTFGHARHLELVNEDCSRCHTSLPEPGAPHEPPTMASCLSCHEHQEEYDRGTCGTCHEDLWARPLRPVSPFTHDGGFLRGHASAARSKSAACSQCHDQTFCSDCHARTTPILPQLRHSERVDRLFLHRDDFVARHALEANADPASCARCHTVRSCEGCHDARNLAPGGTNPRNPHPAGWVFPGGVAFHGDSARRDIGSCAACHDRGGLADCVDCHRSGGIGGNPHPPEFLSRHPNVDRTNPVCLGCHR